MRPTPPSNPHTISRYAYAELRAFCRQYGEKKSRAAALAGVSSPILTGMPHGSDISDPVTRAVERRERLLADCAMIERAAELAGGGGFYHALILNCCHGIGYHKTVDPVTKDNVFERVVAPAVMARWHTERTVDSSGVVKVAQSLSVTVLPDTDPGELMQPGDYLLVGDGPELTEEYTLKQLRRDWPGLAQIQAIADNRGKPHLKHRRVECV